MKDTPSHELLSVWAPPDRLIKVTAYSTTLAISVMVARTYRHEARRGFNVAAPTQFFVVELRRAAHIYG